jgi:hypothetical protein
MGFTGNMNMEKRLGRLVEEVRTIEVMLKGLKENKKILTKVKVLKDMGKFKKMFISPDLTRRQQKRQIIEKTVENDSQYRRNRSSY